MNKKIPLEERARLFLLEAMHREKQEYSFSNPEFTEEIRFLESKSYVTRINNNGNFPNYAVTPKGIEFAAPKQKAQQ